MFLVALQANGSVIRVHLLDKGLDIESLVEEVKLLVTLVEVLSVGIFHSSPHRQCSVVQRAQT